MVELLLQENVNLQVAKTYHNILKMNIGLSKFESTSATSAITNTQCCQSVIRNLVYKFVCRLDKSKNTIVYTVQEYVPTGGGCFIFMACSTLYEITISVVCSAVSLL